MSYKKIIAQGYWKDDKKPFHHKIVVLGDWNGEEDEEDEYIFFYLNGEEPIGDHGDFFITNYEVWE